MQHAPLRQICNQKVVSQSVSQSVSVRFGSVRFGSVRFVRSFVRWQYYAQTTQPVLLNSVERWHSRPWRNPLHFISNPNQVTLLLLCRFTTCHILATHEGELQAQ